MTVCDRVWYHLREITRINRINVRFPQISQPCPRIFNLNLGFLFVYVPRPRPPVHMSTVVLELTHSMLKGRSKALLFIPYRSSAKSGLGSFFKLENAQTFRSEALPRARARVTSHRCSHSAKLGNLVEISRNGDRTFVSREFRLQDGGAWRRPRSFENNLNSSCKCHNKSTNHVKPIYYTS